MNDIFELIKNAQSPYTTIYECLLKSDSPFSKSTGEILFAYSQNFLQKPALKAYNKLDAFNAPNHQHAFVYYMTKSLLESGDTNPSAAQASLKCARSFLLKNDPDHIKLWLQIYELSLQDNNEKQPFFTKIIKKLDLFNNFEYYLWTQICGALAESGLLKLNLNKPDISHRYTKKPTSFDILLFKNYVAKGNPRKAQFYLNKIDPKHYDLNILLNIDFLEILKGNTGKGQLKNIPHASPIQIKHNEFYKELLNKNIDKALQLAKDIVELGHIKLKWTNLILADAEICHLNTEAATYLIDQSHTSMSASDHLMLSRIEYQNGNLPRCAEHFLYSLNESKRLDMHGYFLFRLKCAVELKPIDMLIIMNEVHKISQKNTLRTTNFKVQAVEKYGLQRYLGISKNSLKVKEEIKLYANIDMPILITGETGTGKEVVAQALHEESNHAKEPFLPINCGAIVGTLLQSELFGHTAGAFTSANKSHVGIFEAAGKGTVFLDEFGEMSAETQVALLRVLETRTIRPIGSSQIKKINCHIIVATNANLAEMIKSGKFRSDLYYRLKSLAINLTPLRERKEDIISLALYFLNNKRTDEHLCKIDSETKELLQKHPWPGNTRELKNEMQKVRILNSNKLSYSPDDFTFLYDLKDHTEDSPFEEINQNTTETAAYKTDSHTKTTLAINGRSTHRRLQKVRDLFMEYKTLRRIELINTLNVSQATATKDLKILAEEGFIQKITPTKSSRTHYFELSEHLQSNTKK